MFEWQQRDPVAAELEESAPGQALVSALLGLDVADLDGAALVETVAGWERVISWATAAQAAAVAEMSRRATSGRQVEFVADEIAARLATTRRAAERTVALAAGLSRIPAVHDALAAGWIDVRKATVLTEETAHLPVDDALRLCDAMLPEAGEMTGPQLGAAVRRHELALDPAAAERRHERARSRRSVTLTPASCAMAWLTAYLPADGALTVMTAIDAIAGPSTAADDRGIDARRADALVDVMSSVLDTGVDPTQQFTTQQVPTEQPTTPPLTTQQPMTEPTTRQLPTRQRRRPHLQVTASAATLLGLDEAPAALAGYGPIPPSMARRIASGSTWRPLLVDHESGELLARGAQTYRPPASVAGLVVDRDVTCTFPGCRVRAERCDLDHIDAFDPGQPADEQTRCANLQALCRHHHRLKTLGRWKPVRDTSTGVTHWRAPTGHVYERRPIPTDPSHCSNPESERASDGDGSSAPPF